MGLLLKELQKLYRVLLIIKEKENYERSFEGFKTIRLDVQN